MANTSEHLEESAREAIDYRTHAILDIYQANARNHGHETAVVLILDGTGNCVEQFGFDLPGDAQTYRSLIDHARNRPVKEARCPSR